jgi:transposase
MVNQRSQGSRPLTIIRIGLDTAKHVFQVHGVDENERAVLRRQVRRSEVEKVFAKLPPTRIGLEACGASHHWARVLRGLGHEVVLMPAQYVKPYVKRGKNDALDAAAICEAMSRPGMRFVPVKSTPAPAARARRHCRHPFRQAGPSLALADRFAGAKAEEARGDRAGRQDGPDPLGHDGERRSLPPAASGIAGSSALPDLAFARTTARWRSVEPRIGTPRSTLWGSDPARMFGTRSAEPIWAIGRSDRTHRPDT